MLFVLTTCYLLFTGVSFFFNHFFFISIIHIHFSLFFILRNFLLVTNVGEEKSSLPCPMVHRSNIIAFDHGQK